MSKVVLRNIFSFLILPRLLGILWIFRFTKLRPKPKFDIFQKALLCHLVSSTNLLLKFVPVAPGQYLLGELFFSQPAFCCSKLTIEKKEQGVKYVQSFTLFWCLYCQLLTYKGRLGSYFFKAVKTERKIFRQSLTKN